MTSCRLQSNYSSTAARRASRVTSRQGDTLFRKLLNLASQLFHLELLYSYSVVRVLECCRLSKADLQYLDFYV